MANTFLQLPAPAANGVGTAVDVSNLGATKTIVVAGNWSLTPNITIEVNNDAAQQGGWAPLDTLQGGGFVIRDVACQWMRARVSNFKNGQAPVVWVGAKVDPITFADLPAPGGNGFGPTVDVSTLGIFKSIQVGGVFDGATIIEISENGGLTWAEILTFNSPGLQSLMFTARFMRVKRVGVFSNAPGLPIVNVAAAEGMGGNAGGGGLCPFVWGNENLGATAGTRFLSPGHDFGMASTTDTLQFAAPQDMTLRNLFVRHNTGNGNGNPVVYTLMVNGSPTALTVSLATGAIGQASDLVNEVMVTEGDRLSMRAVKAVNIMTGALDVQVSLIPSG